MQRRRGAPAAAVALLSDALLLPTPRWFHTAFCGKGASYNGPMSLPYARTGGARGAQSPPERPDAPLRGGWYRTSPVGPMRSAWRVAVPAALIVLAGCGSIGAGVGVGVPLAPGVSLGVGLGSGGVHAGVGAGAGPVGVGVGVNQRGQVGAGVGVGAGTSVGKARVGAGVGTGTVIHDPQDKRRRER